ncbi:MAG: hypothetical protein ABJO02_11935, partial [Reichenbachiella sp.]|uniref:hypothetical protein n=1 Tax=Reichenbachiella sp. TaxID=2184521 RepID=UPI003299B890
SDPVWRKHKAYTYTANALNTRVDADGLVAFNPATFDDFESWKPTDPSPGEEWQKTSEITLYDRYSHALEATDINGHFAATKMDSKQEKVLSTVANASYNELAYSGAEDALSGSYFGGSVSKGDATHFTAPALGHASVHTGYSSLSASSGTKAFSFEATATADRKMKVSVWSNKNDGLLKFKKNGGAETPFPNIVERRTGANGWYLLTATVAVNDGDKLEAWCESGSDGTYFDDFRVHPIDAPMTAYVYNEYDELAFVLDNNNLFTEYEYDDMGRLASTYRESFKYGRKKVSSYSVHYSNEPNSNK